MVHAASDGPGRGSELTVRLPLLPAAGRALDVAASGATRVERPVWRVLLGEDNRDAAETLAELLEHWGHRVRVAFDGRGALAAGPESRLEVVLLDLGLPGMTDYEVASHLRAGEVGAPRVVALTGYGDRDSRRRVPEAEFDHHLTKPATEWIHPCSLPSCSICLSQVRVRV